jgi:hypothetical protein
MYYEINVTKDGKHYFATAARSLTDFEQARKAFLDLRRRFPASEGYEVTATKWESVGTQLEWI